MKNNILKSIFVTILLLLGVSHAAWGTAEWLSEGGIKLYFTTDQGEKTVSFNNTSKEVDLGNCSTLKLTKVECKLRKDNNGDICSASIGYKINGDQKSDINCSKWVQSESGGYIYQTISAENLNINLLEGLSQGQTHTIQLWGFAKVNTSGGSGCPNNPNSYYSNSGNNYKITFTYPATWQIKGNLDNNNWPLHSFVNIDANKGSYIYSGLTAQTYEFVVVPPTNNGDFKACEITELSKAYTLVQNGQGNAKFTPPYAGAYMFIWDYNLHTMTVEYLGTEQCNLLYEENDETSVYTAKEMHNTSPMRYDRETSSYYIDITTTKKFLSYRYQKAGHSAMYAANWNSYPNGTEVVANGAKVDANQDVSNWESRSVCYYQGTSGDNIRIWIDYNNKKTWITKEASSYTVTFNANGRGTAPVAQNVTSGGKATEPAAPTAAGFTFGGWYTNADCTGNKYDFANTTVTGNITLYAKWTENKYTVTISAGEGGSVSPNGTQQVGSSGVTITATPNTGYVFDSWAVTGGATVNSTTEASTTLKATADGTVTANFSKITINRYTVVGGSSTVFGTANCPTCTDNDMTLQKDGTYKLVKKVNCLAPTTRDFYIVGNQDEKVWRFPASDKLSYTNSTIGCYTITFTLDLSGSVSATATVVKDDPATTEFYYYDSKGGWDDTKCKGLTKTANYAYVELTKSDYSGDIEFKIFNGNTKSKDNWYGSTDHIDEKCHTVACGSNISSTLKGNIGLTSNTGDYPNAKFNVSSLATETFYIILYYPNTSENSTNDYVLAASTTLPGVETYTVTFDMQEHGEAIATQNVTSGGKVTKPDDPTATGFTFGGWYKEAACKNAWDFETMTVTANLTLYAKWTAEATSFYYHDEKNTKWQGDGREGTANAEEGYVYWQFPKNQYDDNNFKIFNCKPKPADEQEGKIHPNLIGYDEKIDNTLSNGGLTLTDPSGDTWHNIRLPNVSNDYYIVLYLPKSKYNSTEAYKVAIRVTLPGTTVAETYWYFDDKNTGWSETVPIADKWKFIDAGGYAYVSVPAGNEDNYFKIFNHNPKDENCLVANGANKATGELEGDIPLTAQGGQYNNIKIEATCSDYFVVLYYPSTILNPDTKPVVAAMYELPGAEQYNLSFGVVGNSGGTLTAKSGCNTLTPGQMVSHATFTATPAAGYSVEGWYSDADGKQKIAEAGTKTTYSQAITKANNTVYVKFTRVYAIYYKFNDQNWNDDYYAYIFTDEVWHSENGVQPRNNRSEYGKMSKYNDSVYYYKFTGSADYPRFAFSWGDHNNDDYFCRIDAVYRSDFHKDMPVFIAEKGQSADTKNQTKYYNKGVWMKFNDTAPGYNLCLSTNNGFTWDEGYRFTAAKAGDYISTVDVVLTKDVIYQFWVKNDKPYYFKTGGGTCKPTNHQFTFYTYDKDGRPITITPTVTGTYTFQLNLANGKVEIDVLYPTTQYRLVYVEKDGSTIKKFHPSHIIKSHPEATDEAPVFDTVSMHVRPKVLGGNSGKDTLNNTYNCAIVLQKYELSSQTWQDGQTIDVKNGSFSNGVYNFVVKQDGSSVTIDETKTHPYTGRYYIRTDASNGGWNNYKQLKNYCYYTEYSRVYRDFDYYYCHWTTTNTNIKYTIACDYSYCVSDTLAQEQHTQHCDFTDGNGKLSHNANIRFMWNSFDNTLDRAYLAGAGDNIYLLSESGIYNTDGTTQATSVKLEDQNNWVYRADVKATTNARIKLRVLPYNDADFYSWFRGAAGDFSEGNTDQLIGGKEGNKYRIRVIYDFKTDHLICAWIPDGEITEDEIISADLMIIRENQGDAAQLTFNPDTKKLSKVTTAFCVLTFTKAHLENTSLPEKTRKCYWVSFPFDVNLSDVFGCGTFGTDFTLQYYSGSSRAKYGCWSDSESYWYYITNPKAVLKKGRGYVVVIDSEKILREQFQHGNSSVSLYFPSANTEPMDISGELTTVKVPEYKCTIEREQRYIYDSNWNLIGVPSWANIDEFGNPMVATDYEPTPSGQQFKVGFHYVRNAEDGTWTTDATDLLTFKSMYAYLVQWAGTINWQEKKYDGDVHPNSPAQQALQARRNAAAEEGEATAPEQYTLRLTLRRGDQQLDHTYVRLQEGNVTTDFDLNYDMTKIINSGANIYSLVGTQRIQCAANVQPLQEEAQTISIPLGVVADQDGLYTFSLPDGTEGMNVSIADSESGTVHNLALGDYQTALTKGTYEGRFALEIQPRQEVSTGCEQTDAAGKSLRKVLIDGNLYILRDGKAYTATGNEL